MATTTAAPITSPSSSGSPTASITKVSSKRQWIHILRHGERRDFIELHTPSADWHRYDPPLSPHGHTQAGEAGVWIGDAINNSHFSVDRIICSPFIRTVETAWNVVKAVRAAGGRIGPISIEYGVAEWHPQTWIKPFLPQKTAHQIITEHEGNTTAAGEIAHAAIDHDYKTLFGDTYFHDMINAGIGESLEAAYARAAQVVDLLTARFPNENLLIVTHAINSIGLARVLLKNQSFPVRAGVCSIASVQRAITDVTPSSPSLKWDLIHNGLSQYLSRGEQHLWLIPGEEERVYGVRKVPVLHTKVPVYVTLTDEEKAAWLAKQTAATTIIAATDSPLQSSITSTTTTPATPTTSTPAST